MSDARLPINHGDTGKVSRDKINDSFNDLVTTVEGYRPHIEAGIWWIGTTNTGVKAMGDNVEMKVEDGYIRYKSSSVNQWTQIIAIEDLKGDKGDTGDAATVCVGTVCTGAPGTDVCIENAGTQYAAVLNFTIPRGATGCKGDTGASICAAEFCGDDMVFTKDDSCQVVLCGAKNDLKGQDGANICAAAFSGDDIVFTEDNGCTVTLCDAKNCLQGPEGVAATVTVGTTCTGEPGGSACVTNSGTSSAAVLDFTIPTGAQGPTGNGICCVTCDKVGKTTTVTTHYTDGTCSCFTVNDGEDGQGSGDMLACVYDPNNIGADAFDYCNFINKPQIPTDNCELANSCGYTTCIGTVVASDLTPYALACNIPTDNCQLGNSCGFITNAVNDLANYYKKCETYTQCEINTLISNFGGFEKVSTLPITDIKTNVIYLLGPIGTGPDKYEEYIYSSNTWVLIGETSVDLTNYAQCCDIPTDNCQLCNSCGYTTCTGTLVASDIECLAQCCDIPTDNCQLSNSCGYTTCTGTLTAANIDDTAFGSSWDCDTTHAPSKNAVYDVLGDVETLLAAL